MNRILATIVFSQFVCTSLWFAGNAVLPDLIVHLSLEESFLAHLTSAVQFGFISGTLLFALFTVSDRYSPSKVFFVSAVLAAIFNVCSTINGIGPSGLLSFRFMTGFFLAGIYPVGMKIASDYYQKGLGKSLGFLVGALVIGTAFPHLLKNITAAFHWNQVMFGTSALSVVGGFTILLAVPDGPFRKSGQSLKLTAFLDGFKNTKFRSAAFGYFGHMWELYAFWAFVPLMLSAFNNQFPESNLNVPLLSFLVIASGGVACAMGGLLSQLINPKTIATIALFASGMCCITSPLFLFQSSPIVFITFLFFWGLVVVADSPLFSTLIAQYAPEESRGTSLTIVNSIGFAITIVSIQFIAALNGTISGQYIYMLLGIGPFLGLVALVKEKDK